MTNKGKIALPENSRERPKQFLKSHQRLRGVVYARFISVLISFCGQPIQPVEGEYIPPIFL